MFGLSPQSAKFVCGRFRLPEQLSSLALGNRRVMYNLLFQTAWQALREVLQEQFGFQPAAVMVLHT